MNDVIDSKGKHNIERESQRGVVIYKPARRIKMTEWGVVYCSAKHVTRKRELNNKLKELICNTSAT